MSNELFLDIETLGDTADNYIITAIGFSLGREINILFAETPEEEVKILENLKNILHSEQPDLIVTWHGSDFDLPFIKTRAIINGVDLSIISKIPHIDVRQFIEKNLLLSQKRLMDVVKVFGLKKGNMLDGLDMPRYYFSHIRGIEGKEEIISHCEDDVRVLIQLYEKIKLYLLKS